jgi:hypothetical protein
VLAWCRCRLESIGKTGLSRGFELVLLVHTSGRDLGCNVMLSEARVAEEKVKEPSRMKTKSKDRGDDQDGLQAEVTV